MRYLLAVSIALLFIAGMIGCSADKPAAPEPVTTANTVVSATPEQLAAAIVSRTDWEIEAPGPVVEADFVSENVPAFAREVLVGDIVHYSAQVRTGPGIYDVIGIHRVVRETRPYRPVRTRKAVFMQHGDAVGFVKFLFGAVSPNTPDDHAAAVFLAQNGVDVWGIDQDWILVPETETDLSFMADWGLQHQVDNLDFGMAVARHVRLMTGNGWRKMHLLGYSSGVYTGFAMVNQETRLQPGLRNVDGYIPVDVYYKTDDEALRLFNCGDIPYFEDLLDSGVYADNGGIVFRTVGALAETDPGGASPIIPGYTNMQVALLFGAQTYLFFPNTPWYHFVAGVIDGSGMAVDLQYTPIPGWLDFIQSAGSYEPNRFILDYIKVTCDEEDVPFDDHLGEVRNPIFYVGAGGGFGETGLYTLSLLGSSDISWHIVQLHPADEHTLDFGHIDLWTADNAVTEVWTPILEWIDAHMPGEGNDGRYTQH